MSTEKEDGAVEKLMEQGNKQIETSGDKYDEVNNLDVSDHKETAYAGMGKEELMKYANSPFWVRLRWLLFVIFWLTWFAMLFGALFIIFMTPKCFPSTKLEWYQKSPVYVVNAASLSSQNGLDEKVQYMQTLGIENVVLSSVFNNDKGEVVDFMKVNASLGNENFLKDLIVKLKSKGMKVMLKLIPNHSSTSNLFFERSVLNETMYRNYYIWNPGFSVGVHHYPINNWLSVTGKSAWTWNKERNEFYLHQFSENEADFNFRNNDIINYFENVFKLWLTTGVDGFYLDKVQYLFKDKEFKNSTDSSKRPTFNLSETTDLISKWGKLIENNSGILIVSDLETNDVSGVNMVHSSITLAPDFTGEQLLNAILLKTTTFKWPSWEWVCEKNDKPNCWKNETIDAFNIISALLPGTPFINADQKLFENNHIPNVTLFERTLKELRAMPTIEFGSFNTKLLNDTVFVFDRVMSGSESIVFAWNLSKNDTILNLNLLDEIPDEVNLSLCTRSACLLLPALKSKVNSNKINIASESAVVLSFYKP